MMFQIYSRIHWRGLRCRQAERDWQSLCRFWLQIFHMFSSQHLMHWRMLLSLRQLIKTATIHGKFEDWETFAHTGRYNYIIKTRLDWLICLVTLFLSTSSLAWSKIQMFLNWNVSWYQLYYAYCAWTEMWNISFKCLIFGLCLRFFSPSLVMYCVFSSFNLKCAFPQVEDIDDPLYRNIGGAEEMVIVFENPSYCIVSLTCYFIYRHTLIVIIYVGGIV